MELASYLAGERWSDHPECTHPALAALARDVNDYTSDAARHRLAPLIPSVVGLDGRDRRIEVDIALRAATAALPIAAEERQRVLAVGILRCRATRLQDAAAMPTDELDQASRRALDAVPLATRWAREFIRTSAPWARSRPQRRPYAGIIHQAVRSIAGSCATDPDAELFELLRDAIDDCRRRTPAKSASRTTPIRANA